MLRCRRDDRFIPVVTGRNGVGVPIVVCGGDFLFDPFCTADTFYASVVTRFVTYGVELPPLAAAYRDAVLARCRRCWNRLCRCPRGRAAGDVRDLLSGHRAGEL